ncbi:hypothetical protein FRB99_006076 [Tulasnella sp. 403]|nr:hypothetical protein FRB99_006076 [Tulasnella sp. 403]
MSEPHRIAGGYKAAMHNPRVSDEAKQHASQELNRLERSGDLDYDYQQSKPDPNVTRGQKAAIHNPRVSEEAKSRLREDLDSKGVEFEE